MTPQKDLEGIKGNNFNFHVTYYDENDSAISATFDKVTFSVFRALPMDEHTLIIAGVTGVTYYVPTGTGGLTHDSSKSFVYRNKDENLASLTGGIYVSIDSDIMGSIPSGRHFYSLEIFNGNTFSDTLLRGRFELSNEDGGLL